MHLSLPVMISAGLLLPAPATYGNTQPTPRFEDLPDWEQSEQALAVLAQSRALWNRSCLDLNSDEMLGQLLDRGTMEDWRALYVLANGNREMRQRIAHVVMTVPLPLPRFWLAALASLGEPVELGVQLPVYGSSVL